MFFISLSLAGRYVGDVGSDHAAVDAHSVSNVRVEDSGFKGLILLVSRHFREVHRGLGRHPCYSPRQCH